MKAKLALLAGLVFWLAVPGARAQEAQWVRQFGAANSEQAFGIAVDASGVYVAGLAEAPLPDHSSAGGFAAFVRKYDANGNLLWDRQLRASNADRAFGIAVEASGVYVAGRAGTGTLLGQPGTGGGDAFVHKYDANGNELWTRQFGSPNLHQAFGIAVDAPGVYVVGLTAGALPGQTSGGGLDAVVAKLVVVSVREAIQRLIADVVTVNLQQGIASGLDLKLEAAVEALDDVNGDNHGAAINALRVFIHAVEVQRGVYVPESAADALVVAAQDIIAMQSGY